MALTPKQYSILTSWLLVLLFLLATAAAFFVLVGVTTNPFYKVEGRIELNASQNQVRDALLDVTQFPALRKDIKSLRIIDKDKNGPLVWEASMLFDKNTRFVREKEKFLDKIVVFQESPARNTRSVLSYYIEPLGVNRTRVIITEERHMPQWFYRSFFVFYGMDSNMRNELNYLRAYFNASTPS